MPLPNHPIYPQMNAQYSNQCPIFQSLPNIPISAQSSTILLSGGRVP
jgi:hypothetical protein